MNCVVVAGGRPAPGESLYRLTQGRPKALIKIGGQPMIDWVIAALTIASNIDDISVIGLDRNTSGSEQIDYLPGQANLIENIIAGVQWHRAKNSEDEMLAICTSDIPLITGSIVDEFVTRCHPHDNAVYYPVATREVMEKRFPGANRTYARFKDVDVAGGDLLLVNPNLLDLDSDLYQSIFNARKYPWRIARLIGLGTLLKFVTRQLTLKEAESKGREVVDQPVKVMVVKNAELAMDVDKTEHIKMVESELT